MTRSTTPCGRSNDVQLLQEGVVAKKAPALLFLNCHTHKHTRAQGYKDTTRAIMYCETHLCVITLTPVARKAFNNAVDGGTDGTTHKLTKQNQPQPDIFSPTI